LHYWLVSLDEVIFWAQTYPLGKPPPPRRYVGELNTIRQRLWARASSSPQSPYLIAGLVPAASTHKEKSEEASGLSPEWNRIGCSRRAA